MSVEVTDTKRRVPPALIALGLAGSALTLFAGKGHLPGLGNDATSYWAIADRLEGGRGLGYFLEPKLTLWPPGWPAYLAFMKWTTPLSVPVIGLWTNALLVVVLTLLTWALIRRFTMRPLLVWAACISAAVGPATLSQSYFLQTEISFCCLVLGCFLFLLRYAQRRRPVDMVAAVLLMWLAFMDRYVGIVAIGTGALWLFVSRGATARQRVMDSAAFFIGSCIVPALWLLRNVATNDWQWGTAFGPRDTPLATYKTNLADAITSLGQYVTGVWRYEPWRGVLRLAVLSVLAVCVLVALALARRWRAARVGHRTVAPSGVGELLDAAGHPLGLLVIYVAAHFGYMIYSASTIAFDPVNTRYLVPMFLPAVIVALTLVDRGAYTDPHDHADRFARVVRAAVGVWIAAQVVTGVAMASLPWWNDKAAGYNGDAAISARRSDVIAGIPPDCRLYASMPLALYPLGLEPGQWPRRTKFASSDVPPDLEELRRTLDDHDVCLLWIERFDEQVSGYVYSPEQLAALFPGWERIAGDGDITVYRIPRST